MEKMFDEIFEDVMKMLGLKKWYHLFDTDNFKIVEERITMALGHNCWEDDEFVAWHKIMATDDDVY